MMSQLKRPSREELREAMARQAGAHVEKLEKALSKADPKKRAGMEATIDDMKRGEYWGLYQRMKEAKADASAASKTSPGDGIEGMELTGGRRSRKRNGRRRGKQTKRKQSKRKQTKRKQSKRKQTKRKQSKRRQTKRKQSKRKQTKRKQSKRKRSRRN